MSDALVYCAVCRALVAVVRDGVAVHRAGRRLHSHLGPVELGVERLRFLARRGRVVVLVQERLPV